MIICSHQAGRPLYVKPKVLLFNFFSGWASKNRMQQFSNHKDESRIIEYIEKMSCWFLKYYFHYQVMGNMFWSWKRFRTSSSKSPNCEYIIANIQCKRIVFCLQISVHWVLNWRWRSNFADRNEWMPWKYDCHAQGKTRKHKILKNYWPTALINL